MENTRDEMVPEHYVSATNITPDGRIEFQATRKFTFAELEAIDRKIKEIVNRFEFQENGQPLGGIRADGSTWGIFGKTPEWVAVDVDNVFSEDISKDWGWLTETPSLESLDGPRGALGPSCAPGPVYLIGGSQKPLMYSVDVFKSLKEGEYIAITSFPLVVDGHRVKPYAAGQSPDLAKANLATAITGLTSRRELGVINEHFQITKWVCLHCDHVTGFATKQDLTTHLTQSHGGNLSVDRYTNPSVNGVYHKLP